MLLNHAEVELICKQMPPKPSSFTKMPHRVSLGLLFSFMTSYVYSIHCVIACCFFEFLRYVWTDLPFLQQETSSTAVQQPMSVRSPRGDESPARPAVSWNVLKLACWRKVSLITHFLTKYSSRLQFCLPNLVIEYSVDNNYQKNYFNICFLPVQPFLSATLW